MTISCRNSQRVLERLKTIQVDNTGIAKRPLYDRIRKEVLPAVNKLFRTVKLPFGLDEQEKNAKRKIEWPRSIYKYKTLLESCEKFRFVKDTPYKGGPELVDSYTHPWKSSDRFDLDLSLERNVRALRKAPGLPSLRGTKKDNLAEARQYVESVLKPANSIDKAFSIFPGHRTQQSPPEDPKVRLVWMIPISEWLIECEAIDDAITRTVKENLGGGLNIRTFYSEPNAVFEWVKDNWSECTSWVCLDATSYDATVGASELAAGVHHFCSAYEFSDMVSSYLQRAQLVLPEGDLVRRGGMPSGTKFTNLLDGWTNCCDHFEALDRSKYLKYVRCVLVNGDDISIGFSSKFTKDELAKWFRFSRRTIDAEKSIDGGYCWNSKWYIDSEVMTRTVYRVLNSAMFNEHTFNPLTGTKEYVAISLASQLSDIQQHPLANDVYKLFAKIDKYPLAQMERADLVKAADAFIDQHNWEVDWLSSPDTLVERLLRSPYAENGV